MSNVILSARSDMQLDANEPNDPNIVRLNNLISVLEKWTPRKSAEIVKDTIVEIYDLCEIIGADASDRMDEIDLWMLPVSKKRQNYIDFVEFVLHYDPIAVDNWGNVVIVDGPEDGIDLIPAAEIDSNKEWNEFNTKRMNYRKRWE